MDDGDDGQGQDREDYDDDHDDDHGEVILISMMIMMMRARLALSSGAWRAVAGSRAGASCACTTPACASAMRGASVPLNDPRCLCRRPAACGGGAGGTPSSVRGCAARSSMSQPQGPPGHPPGGCSASGA